MRKWFFILLAVFAVFAATAANYPDRADYLWYTVPDHADWLYDCGEKARLEVQLCVYGVPQDVEVKYEIADDLQPSDASGVLKLKNGRGTLSVGTKATPGFRDVRLEAVVGGKTYKHHIKLGFGVSQIQPAVKEPADFMEFWDAEIEAMRQKPLSYTMEPAPEYCTDKIDCFLVRLYTVGGRSVFGYLFFPKGAKLGECPVVLCPPGAGVKTIKLPLRHKYYAENGCVRFEVEIHGLDPRFTEDEFAQMAAAFSGTTKGYLTYGIESRDRYYMKDVYLGMVRCLDFLCSLPEWDGRNVIVQGGSQGGALSLVAAGLDSRVTQCIVNHPALADMAPGAGRADGYPHFCRTPEILTPQAVKTLQYFDAVNFARHIGCKVRMTWGYNDDACPPTTSYAVWNVLDCPKESLITPVNEHWTSEATEYSHCMWMLENLE